MGTTLAVRTLIDLFKSRRRFLFEAIAVNLVTAVILALAVWLWERASTAFSPASILQNRSSILVVALLTQSLLLVVLSFWFPPKIVSASGFLRRVLRNVFSFSMCLVACWGFVDVIVAGIGIWSEERYDGLVPFLLILGTSVFLLLLGLCGLPLLTLMTAMAIEDPNS